MVVPGVIDLGGRAWGIGSGWSGLVELGGALEDGGEPGVAGWTASSAHGGQI